MSAPMKSRVIIQLLFFSSLLVVTIPTFCQGASTQIIGVMVRHPVVNTTADISVVFNIQIQSFTSDDVNVTVTAQQVPVNWNVMYLNPEFILPGNQQQNLSLRVEPMSDSDPGNYTITLEITARSVTSGELLEEPLRMSLRVHILERPLFQITSETDQKSVKPGEQAVFPIKMTNLGNQSIVVSMALIDYPAEWKASTDVSQILLSKGESKIVNLTVTPPSSTERVLQSFTLNATGSLNESFTSTISLHYTVIVSVIPPSTPGFEAPLAFLAMFFSFLMVIVKKRRTM
jgi:uncharacterized membrane protein